MSQSKQSLNEIRRGRAEKLKPLQICTFDSSDQDVPSIQVNKNNWNSIKSVFVTSLPEELNELSCDATNKSFVKLQKSQQKFSEQIYRGIVKLAKDSSIMEDTDEFYDDGNQFDDAIFDFVDSSRRLKSKSEDKHEREVLFFFWREYNIYRRDVCPRNTRKKYIPKHEWEEPKHETFLEYYTKRTDPSKCYLSPYTTESSYNIPVNQLVDFFYAELLR